SSRRRHTISKRDWSSDVCSSDLRMRSEDWDRVGKARESLDAAPLFIDESPENTVMDIVAKTKMMVKRHGIKLIVVDYLQLLHSGKREESRQQEEIGRAHV